MVVRLCGKEAQLLRQRVWDDATKADRVRHRGVMHVVDVMGFAAQDMEIVEERHGDHGVTGLYAEK